MKKITNVGIIIVIILFLLSKQVLAAVPTPVTPGELPASVQPGVVSTEMRESKTPTSPESLPPAPPTEEKPENKLGAEAERIKFKLTKIILEDNTVFTEAELKPIYQDKLNKVITVAELQEIVQNITNYYRNNGYILSRAIIPPQRVKEGVIHIRMVEGGIDKVAVIGKPKGAKSLVLEFAQNIQKSKPLQLKFMERNLFLINEIPGVQGKAVLEPAKTKTGSSDLNIATETQTLGGSVSYDNYGTRYVGPQQLTGSVNANSIFRAGDTTRFTYVGASKGNELQYKDLAHDTPLGSNGTRFVLDVNQAITNPLYVLQDLKIAGNAKDLNGTVRYPVIRSRSENLTVEGVFNYLDSYVTQLDAPLYTDHLRTIKIAGAYDFADRYKGANLIGVALVQGLKIFGATANNQSLFTSRYGATGRFTKVTGQVSRLQHLFWKFSLLGLVKGQYAFNPLLASEQFGFGGSQLGRGYDPAEIIGDRGVAASVELHLDTSPGRLWLRAIQFYAFYDAGWTWNLRNVTTVPTKQTANSTGAGMRIYMMKYLSANAMITQPLSRKVLALQQVGNGGSHPRVFFSVTASI